MISPLFTRLLVGGIAAATLSLASVGFQVRETEKAVQLRLGRPVRVLDKAGLYFKAPWPIDSVQRVDARLDFYEIRISEALTRDKRNVIVPVYLAWRVGDPLKFIQALGTVENARAKFDALVTSARNSVLGGYDFQNLVSAEEGGLKLNEMEQKITGIVREQVGNTFGVEVEQIGVKRLSLPEANTQYVFRRMRAERAQFAARYRAEGKQEADAIRAKTDAEKIVTLAEARKYAEETRGKAEAEAARIYAEAHGKDPELYSFLRELQVLRQVAGQNTTLVLDTNSEPFRLLKSPAARKAVPPVDPATMVPVTQASR